MSERAAAGASAKAPGRAIRLVRESFPARPALDTAVSQALLRRVSAGLEPETLRVYRPAASVAFGPQDRIDPGYRAAVQAARAGGFAAIERLAGGRAAVFHEQTIAFSWTIPDPAPANGIRARFEELAEILAAAFRRLGVDARVGAVPGEYCPGDYSVNARGRTKLMGVGQRLVARAAHVGGVVVVGESRRVRDILIPVYEALRLTWDPATVGSLEDERAGLTWDRAEAAIRDEFAARYELIDGPVAPETLALAEQFEPDHLAPT